MRRTRTDDDVATAFLRASRVLVGVAARSLAALDGVVTLPQYRALVVLSEHESLSIGELARELGVQPSTVTRMADRLEAKELVARVASTADRREVDLQLTAAGHLLIGEVMAQRHTDIAAIVARMPKGQRLAALDALEAFASSAAATHEQEAHALGWP